jgi:hypothetical protein
MTHTFANHALAEQPPITASATATKNFFHYSRFLA